MNVTAWVSVHSSTVNRMVAGSNPARGANDFGNFLIPTSLRKIPMSAACGQIDCAAAGGSLRQSLRNLPAAIYEDLFTIVISGG